MRSLSDQQKIERMEKILRRITRKYRVPYGRCFHCGEGRWVPGKNRQWGKWDHTLKCPVVLAKKELKGGG